MAYSKKMKALYKDAMLEERNYNIYDRLLRKIAIIKLINKHPEVMEDYDREL